MLLVILIIIIAILTVIFLPYLAMAGKSSLAFRLFVNTMRASAEKNRLETAATHKMPAEIIEEESKEYLLYHPKTLSGAEPIIINIHGGGLFLGLAKQNCYWNSLISSQGAIVYAIEYPLIPESSFFEQLQAVMNALHLVVNDAQKRGWWKRKVVLNGDSAGSLLAFYTAAIIANPALAQTFGIEPLELEIKGLCLQCGMFYTDRFDVISYLVAPHIWGLGQKCRYGQIVDPDYILQTTKLPPMLLTTARGDYLKAHTLAFAKVARESGHSVELLYWDDKELKHAFQVFKPERPESLETAKKMVKLVQE